MRMFDTLQIAKTETYQKYRNQYDVLKVNMQEFLSMTHSMDEMLAVFQKRMISTILGQAHINIMGMQVGRMTKSGNNIMAIAVQDDIPNDIMVKLRSINGILDMKLIHCDIH